MRCYKEIDKKGYQQIEVNLKDIDVNLKDVEAAR